jgi:hypothetical protein
LHLESTELLLLRWTKLEKRLQMSSFKFMVEVNIMFKNLQKSSQKPLKWLKVISYLMIQMMIMALVQELTTTKNRAVSTNTSTNHLIMRTCNSLAQL